MSDLPEAKTGRPLIEIDMEQLKKLMQLYPKKEFAASLMRCSVDTLERRIRETEDLTYQEFKEKHSANTAMSIKKKSIDMAMEGNERMITRWLEEMGEWTKGQGSPVQVNVQNNLSQNVAIEPVDIEDRIKQLQESKDKEPKE